MLSQHIERAIEHSSLRDLDHVARNLWQAYGSGAVSEPDAERLASALELRRGVRRAELPKGMAGAGLAFVPRRPQRSPDRQRSVLRRRQLAAGGALPPPLAAMFTTSELAVLNVVGAEVRQNGTCTRSLDELAARAGVCRRTAQRAIREAARTGLLTIQERPRSGQKSETNVLRVVSKEWTTWLQRGGRQAARHRVTISTPHGQQQESPAVQKGGESPPAVPMERPRSLARSAAGAFFAPAAAHHRGVR